MSPVATPESSRRTLLRSIGALSVAGMTGLAGCGGGDGDGADGEGFSGSEYPAVEEWMTETDVGGADDTYDGAIEDRREESEVTIDVGAEGNGGAYAFGPSAVAVSAGTEVV